MAQVSDETRTILRSAPTQGGPRLAVFDLLVVDGPDLGQRARLDGPGRLLVGQSPACGLRLRDPHVSRRHLAFTLEHGRLRMTDLGSTNGTRVNDVEVIEAFLAGNERVRIGDTSLVVERAQAESTPLTASLRFGRVVGASPEMRRLYPLCERIAQSHVPVVIEGETGTGKELLAEALHDAGPRASGPFVVFDCTTVPPNLAESMLFGHERGAFTGAINARKGVFELAHQGTLFIDEIGDLDLTLQPKLLRAIERAEVQRVGSERWTKVDVRVVAATRRDLDHEIQVGRFRDDLFFRLAVARIELPPLRKRDGDIGALARHFYRQLGGDGAIPEELLARFEAHEWPGNVRELSNAVARYLAVGETTLAGLAPSSRRPAESAPASGQDPIEAVLARDLPLPRAREEVVAELERRYIERVLERYGGNVGRAAAASGIARRYFQMIRARHQK
ncbi:MAG: sigma 54-interacting transcriptional regulator [Myxococcales bacterium]|nr:sigma 54-interacting transcriptional regulator [Myxococcales bacterium]